MNRLKELRREMHLTQAELGKKIHVKGALISKYENEKVPLTAETIKTLCNIFDCSSDYLLCRAGANRKAVSEGNLAVEVFTAREEDLITAFRKLTPDDQDIVIGEVKKTLKGYGQAPSVLHSSKPGPVAAESDQEELRQAK